MKFECDSCGANYKIADEKVSGKGVKVKCKRCGHVIIVRPSDAAAAAEPAAENEDDVFGATHADAELPGDLDALGFDGDADKTTGDGPLFTDSEGDAGAFGEMTLAQNDAPAAALAHQEQNELELPAENDANGDLVAAASSDSERPPWEDDDSDATAFGSEDRTGADLGSPFGDDAPAGDEDAFATPAPAADEDAFASPTAGAEDTFATPAPASDDVFGATAAADDADAEPPAPSEDAFFASSSSDADELPLNDDDESAFGAFDDDDTAVAAGHANDGDEDTAFGEPAAPGVSAFTDEEVPVPGVDDTLLADQEGGAPSDADVGEPPAPELDMGEPPAPDVASLSAAVPEPSAMPDAGGGLALPDPDAPSGSDGLDAQLEGAFSSMFGELPDHDPGDPVPEPAPFDDPFSPGAAPNPTALLDMDQMDQLRADASPTGEGMSLDDAGPGAEESDGWHAAIDDEDHGPMRFSELEGHVRSGAIDPETLVWRSGMSDWLPAGDVAEVSSLFSGIPMPSLGGLDVGAPIDDISPSPFGGPEVSDPFAQTPDAPTADPNWQPHGLTEVYAAANLAEAAGAGAAGGSLGVAAVGLGPAPSAPAADAGGWTPGAASALESLVGDEIARLDTPPQTPSPQTPPPAAEGSLLAAAGISVDVAAPATGGGLSGTFDQPPGTGGLSGAVPATNGDAFSGAYAPAGAAPFGAQSQSMSYAPQGGQSMAYGQSASMAFAPPMQKPQRSPLLYVVAAGGMLIFLLLAIGILKLAFFPSTAQPVAVAAVEPAKGEAQTPPANKAAPADTPTKATPPPGEPKDTAAAAAAANTAEPQAADAKADPPKNTPPPAAEKKDDENAKVASASTASAPPPKSSSKKSKKKKATKKKDASKKRSEKRVAKTDPPKKKASPKRRRKSGGGCDILDPDCDASGSSGAKKKKKTLSKADILGVVKKNIGRVNRCGRKHNGTGSTVKVKWLISKSGKATSVAVKTAAHKSSPLGKCIVSEVKRWRFPKFSSSKPVPVSFPFKLK